MFLALLFLFFFRVMIHGNNRSSLRLWLCRPSGRWQRCWSEAMQYLRLVGCKGVYIQLFIYIYIYTYICLLSKKNNKLYTLLVLFVEFSVYVFRLCLLVYICPLSVSIDLQVRGPVLVLYKVELHHCQDARSPHVPDIKIGVSKWRT